MLLGLTFAGIAVAQLPIKPPPLRSSKAAPSPIAPDACPLTIFIDEQGALFDSRFGGRYRVTEQTLRNDIQGGCKEKGPTSSVRVQPSPHTRFGRVQQVLNLVKAAGPNLPITTVTPHAAH